MIPAVWPVAFGGFGRVAPAKAQKAMVETVKRWHSEAIWAITTCENTLSVPKVRTRETPMKTFVLLASASALLIGCTSQEDRVYFDGEFYRANLRKVDRQFDEFVVTVRPVSKSLTGAVQAGEYEAISYCVNTFGSSDIVWSIGPDTADTQLPIDRDTLTLSGTCPGAR